MQSAASNPLDYERVYLPLCEVADTPFHSKDTVADTPFHSKDTVTDTPFHSQGDEMTKHIYKYEK